MKDNKLIAEFMGMTANSDAGILNYGFNNSWYEEHELSYDISWDWLMPVVDMCYNTNAVTCGECGKYGLVDEREDEIECSVCGFTSEHADFPDVYIGSSDPLSVGDITHALLDCDMDSTYRAVVEFIKKIK